MGELFEAAQILMEQQTRHMLALERLQEKHASDLMKLLLHGLTRGGGECAGRLAANTIDNVEAKTAKQEGETEVAALKARLHSLVSMAEPSDDAMKEHDVWTPEGYETGAEVPADEVLALQSEESINPYVHDQSPRDAVHAPVGAPLADDGHDVRDGDVPHRDPQLALPHRDEDRVHQVTGGDPRASSGADTAAEDSAHTPGADDATEETEDDESSSSGSSSTSGVAPGPIERMTTPLPTIDEGEPREPEEPFTVVRSKRSRIRRSRGFTATHFSQKEIDDMRANPISQEQFQALNLMQKNVKTWLRGNPHPSDAEHMRLWIEEAESIRQLAIHSRRQERLEQQRGRRPQQ